MERRSTEKKINQMIEDIVDKEFRTNEGNYLIDWSAFISLGSEDVVFMYGLYKINGCI